MQDRNQKIIVNRIIDYVSLTKPRVTLGVTLTTITGYAINSPIFLLKDSLILALGVALMSAGAATLNHVVERKTDLLMERTKNRPIASGRILPFTGIVFAIVLLTIGFSLLYMRFNAICAILGTGNALWYILAYTPMKRASIWAVFVGSITGVVPFFIGVVSVTENPMIPINIFLGMYLLMWQIPHFLLLVFKYGREYHQAGLASISNFSSEKTIWFVSHVWIVSCCLLSLFFPIFGFLQHNFSNWVIVIINILVVLVISFEFLFHQKLLSFKIPFYTTNLMQVLLMLVILFDRIVL